MSNEKLTLDYRKQLRRFAEQGNVAILKGELKALQKQRRYLPVYEPLIMEIKELIETAKERKKDLQHHQNRIQLSIEDDKEERERIHQQQEDEEQVKKLREARENFLPLMEEIAKTLAETMEDRVQMLLKDEGMSEYIDRVVDEENADRPEDDKLTREDVARELVRRGDEAMKTVFSEQMDKKPNLKLEEAVPEAKRLVEEYQDDLWRHVWLPVPTPSSSSVLNHKYDDSDELRKAMGFVFLMAGVTVVAVPKEVVLATQKQSEFQDFIRQALEADSNSPSATPKPRS